MKFDNETTIKLLRQLVDKYELQKLDSYERGLVDGMKTGLMYLGEEQAVKEHQENIARIMSKAE